jgi:hypothetical protein
MRTRELNKKAVAEAVRDVRTKLNRKKKNFSSDF